MGRIKIGIKMYPEEKPIIIAIYTDPDQDTIIYYDLDDQQYVEIIDE